MRRGRECDGQGGILFPVPHYGNTIAAARSWGHRAPKVWAKVMLGEDWDRR